MRINLATFLTSTATKITNDDDHSTACEQPQESGFREQVIVGLSIDKKSESSSQTSKMVGAL